MCYLLEKAVGLINFASPLKGGPLRYLFRFRICSTLQLHVHMHFFTTFSTLVSELSLPICTKYGIQHRPISRDLQIVLNFR